MRDTIPNDGNCLFHAVVDPLERLGESGYSHTDLRTLAVQTLRNGTLSISADEMAFFVPNNDFESYVKNMSKDGTLGDHIVLLALANALGKTIRVVTSSRVPDNFEAVVEAENDQEGEPLLLGLLSDNHYFSLEPMDNIASNFQESSCNANGFPSEDCSALGDAQDPEFNADKDPSPLCDVQGPGLTSDKDPSDGTVISKCDKEVEDTWEAFEATSPEEILVFRNNIPITARTFKRLQGDWLNDELVNYFMAYLEEAYKTAENQHQNLMVLDSFFWTRLEALIKDKKDLSALRKSKGPLENANLLMFPINRGNNHWCLGAVDMKEKQVIYYDPMGSSPRDCYDFSHKIRLFLNNWLQDQDVQDQIVWKDRIINHAVQKDRESCGVFMLKMAECLATDVQPAFTQGDCDNFRLGIAHVILHTEECVSLLQRGCKTNKSEGTNETPAEKSNANENSSEYKDKLRRKSRLKRKYKSGEWVLDKKSKKKPKKEPGEGVQESKNEMPLRTDGRNPVDIDCLPDEILQEVFERVCESDGDPAIGVISLVCRRWQRLVQDEVFRKRIHFKWLRTVYDWQKASDDYKKNYYLDVMYDILECIGCNRRYKDMPGFMQRGSKGSLRFYSDAGDSGHPGYCSEFCARVMNAFSDPLEDWEA